MAETATTVRLPPQHLSRFAKLGGSQLEQLDALLGQSKSLSEIQRDAEKVTSSLQSLKDEGTRCKLVVLLRHR